MMSTVVDKRGPHIGAQFANALDIIDCPKFLIAALKSLVSVRFEDRPFTATRMKKIAISGHVPIATISSEDRRWFVQHLNAFSHNWWQPQPGAHGVEVCPPETEELH
jgi:hypothetical protein